MKEITLRVTDDMAQLVEQWAELIPNMEVVDTDNCLDDDNRDLCFRMAIMELRKDNVIRKARDFAWIMAALDQELMEEYEGFYSSQAFIDYMASLGIDSLPDRSTLYRAYKKIDGDYPNWTFMDNIDDKEVSRRKAIVVRFKSAFLRAKRR